LYESPDVPGDIKVSAMPRIARSMTIVWKAIACCSLPLASIHAAEAPPSSQVSLQVGSEFAQRAVNFRTLDLTHDEGVARLYSRIRAAAETVCAPASVEQLRSSVRMRRCQSEAVARAVADVNVPALTNLYQGKKPIVVAAQ
jgi:UrcA family protein